ncbi:MAG: TonB-dependent receptor [Acidobacteria bacterium]|nr:TonB-dependent receptor [Acidobacteriota bacterium]
MHHSQLLSLFIGLAAVLSAQVMSVGSVDGTIKDPSGALLPNVKVTLTNVETNQSRDATTNEIGYYVFPLVQTGRYSVTGEQQGFKRGTQEVTVATGRRSTADLIMQLGEVTESVSVTAQAALLETSTAGVSRNIQQKVIQDLPLLGRNPLMLVNLSPGITNNSTTSSSGLIDIDSVSYSAVNGSNRRQNEFLLDGIPNNVSDRVAYIPSVDDVEEFTVQTNALDAEYGHGGGMYVNMTTKGGTNEFHGGLYEFFRNDKLNANSFFSNRAGAPRPVFRFNQYGLAVGGPVVKNKVFWFFNWESLRQRTPFTYRVTMPTELQRQGDFSQTLDRNGALFQIADPLTTRPNGTGGQIRTLFPGGRIPANRINSIAASVMSRYPRPNGAGDPFTGSNNYFTVVPAPYDGDNYSTRVDPNIKRHRLFARWSHNQGFPGTPTIWDIGAGVGSLEGNNRAQTSIGLSDAFTLSPTMVVTAQAGYTRWTQEGIHPTFDMTSLGFSRSLAGQLQQAIFPRFNVQDSYYMGASEGQWFEHTNTYSFNIGVTKISGSHNMKWGMQGQVKQNNSVPANRPGGEYNFDRGFTQPNPFGPGTNQGNGIASFLLGYPGSGSIDLRALTAPQAPFYGWYFQDDYKVSPKLTLNLGFRYELLFGTTERYNQSNLGFDPNVSNPIEAAAKANYAGSPIPELSPSNFNVKGGLFFATPERRGNVNLDKGSWAPRVGLAYRILPRTVIRTGFGVFYSVWWQPFIRATGFASNTPMVATLDGGLTPADTLSNPFPNGLIQPTGSSLGLKTLLGSSLSGTYDYWRKNQRNFRWSFGFQQEVARNLSIELNYVGQRGTRLPLSTNSLGNDNDRNINPLDQRYFALGGTRLNTRIPNPFKGLIPTPSPLAGDTITVAQLLVPYPEFTAVSLQRNTGGDSYYHSLQASVNKRIGSGLTLQLAYTWSKQLEKLRFIEPSDPEPSKVIGEFDNPHRVAMAAIYELPFGQGKTLRTNIAAVDTIIGGWQWNAMYIYQRGQAVSLPSVLATGISPKLDNRSIDKWFNTDAMKVLPAFTARRIPWAWNELRVPSINNWDMSFMKNTFLYKERVKLQLRCEMINAFNRVWFGGVDVGPTSGSYGRLTSQVNNPRNIQLGMKVIF